MKRLIAALMIVVLTISFSPGISSNASQLKSTSSEQTKRKESKRILIDSTKEEIVMKNNKVIQRNVVSSNTANSEKATKKMYNSNKKSSISVVDMAAKVKDGVVQKSVPLKNHKKGVSTQKKGQISVTQMGYETYINSGSGTITTEIKIATMTGERPTYIIAGNHLYAGDQYNGSYKQVMEHTREFKGANIVVGKKYSKTYKLKSTQYFVAKNQATAAWRGFQPRNSSGQTERFLTNKKAVPYPNIYIIVPNKSKTRIDMAYPNSTKWKKVPTEKRVSWGDKERKTFRNNFEKKYNTKIDWKGLDIHHVKPRLYGGTNTLSNLLPISRTMHQKTISPWWLAY